MTFVCIFVTRVYEPEFSVLRSKASEFGDGKEKEREEEGKDRVVGHFTVPWQGWACRGMVVPLVLQKWRPQLAAGKSRQASGLGIVWSFRILPTYSFQAPGISEVGEPAFNKQGRRQESRG